MSEHSLRLVTAASSVLNAISPLAAFHRVNSLVPDRQELLTVPPDLPVNEAVVLMQEHDFSQVPVVAGPEVIGLFSYRSFARRVPEVKKLQTMFDNEVDEFADEPRFARVGDDLATLLPYLERDGAVLIGDPDNLIALITPTDVTNYLFEVTQPFVLLQEIELVLRSLVEATCGATDLPPRIAIAVARQYEERDVSIPTRLDQLTLSQLVAVVLNRRNYDEVFAAVFGRNRDSSRGQLEPVSDLRNAILHFRRRATLADLEQLAATRSWLLRKARRVSGRVQA